MTKEQRKKLNQLIDRVVETQQDLIYAREITGNRVCAAAEKATDASAELSKFINSLTDEE